VQATARADCFSAAQSYDAVMTLDDVKRLIAPEVPALHACGVTALYVFGSVATGTAGPASDVDVMIDFDPSSGFDLIDLSGVHLWRHRERRDSRRFGQ
jgi:hypothetical protein